MINEDVSQNDVLEKEINKLKNMDPVSNTEASYFIHNWYKEYKEKMETDNEPEKLNPVFEEFFEYFQHFSHLKYGNDLNTEDLKNALNIKKNSLKTTRDEMSSINDLESFEIALLQNLRPAKQEEAIKWIPSLSRKITQGKTTDINQAIEINNKDPNVEF